MFIMPKKILIADDEPNIVRLLASRLKANGYEVVTASDAMQANMIARREKPALIILDYKMPAGDGLKLYDSLQKTSDVGSVPVIFISAHGSDEVKAQALKMGAIAFLAKPFDDKELLDIVKKELPGDKPAT
jgi:DNA-binding response OmpR family regulator